jgi:hypothetical protein
VRDFLRKKIKNDDLLDWKKIRKSQLFVLNSNNTSGSLHLQNTLGTHLHLRRRR